MLKHDLMFYLQLSGTIIYMQTITETISTTASKSDYRRLNFSLKVEVENFNGNRNQAELFHLSFVSKNYKSPKVNK
jgi:hypothetical protein